MISRHYNKDEQMFPLLHLIALEIAAQVSRAVKLRHLFDNGPGPAIDILKKAERVLELWRIHYNEMRDALEKSNSNLVDLGTVWSRLRRRSNKRRGRVCVVIVSLFLPYLCLLVIPVPPSLLLCFIISFLFYFRFEEEAAVHEDDSHAEHLQRSARGGSDPGRVLTVSWTRTVGCDGRIRKNQ